MRPPLVASISIKAHGSDSCSKEIVFVVRQVFHRQ